MKKIILSLAVVAVSSMFASAIPAACAGCHGKNMEKAALGKSKIIKGWPAADTIKAMNGYKDGSYGGPMKGLMKGQVANLDDAKIEAMAKEIEAMK